MVSFPTLGRVWRAGSRYLEEAGLNEGWQRFIRPGVFFWTFGRRTRPTPSKESLHPLLRQRTAKSKWRIASKEG